MNLILWLIIGIATGYYRSSTGNDLKRGESMFISTLAALIGGFASAIVLGYSINGLDIGSIATSFIASLFTLRYFEQILHVNK